MSAGRTPPLAYPARARTLVQAGREALKTGGRDAARPLFAAAMALDPTVATLNWGLLPVLVDQGDGSFRARMQARMHSWYGPDAAPVHRSVADLSQKLNMRRFAGAMGQPLPRLYGAPGTLDSVAWDDLPPDLVIKPVNDASSKGVIVAVGGRDLMQGAAITPSLEVYTSRLYGQLYQTPPEIMIEECLVDVGTHPDTGPRIPRDYKIFAICGHVGEVRIIDRNYPDGGRSQASFDRNGTRLPPGLQEPDNEPDQPLPDGFDALVALAERLSRALPWFLRLDYYLTPSGPVFGEFTTYPNAGLSLTPFARRTLLQMWEIYPDAVQA